MIACQGVHKSFGATAVLTDVSFSVPQGSVVGLLGPNGAGKSTLMKILLGFLAPDSGQAHVLGHPYSRLEAPVRSVGSLLDPTWLDGRLSLRSLFEVHAMRLRLRRPRRVSAEAIERVGLGGSERKRVSRLSLGMRQRAALGLALLGHPSVLVLDEPVNGLDPDGVLWLRALLQDFAARGGAVLLSSHLMSEMGRVADRVVVLKSGNVVADEALGQAQSGAFVQPIGDPGALVRQGQAMGIRLNPALGGLVAEGVDPGVVFDLAVRSGVRLGELRPIRTDLEERYQELTRASH